MNWKLVLSILVLSIENLIKELNILLINIVEKLRILPLMIIIIYKDYISLVFYSELFLGGAHPNHYIDTVIYNTKNNSFININDLINIDKNILIKLSNISREELLRNKVLSNSDVKEMLMDGTSPKTDNFKRLALTDEGIIIFFERYQIAPYYFGDYNILIPYSKLNLNI